MSEKRWKTKSGVVVIERGRFQTTDGLGRLLYKIYATKKPPRAPIHKPTPRAIRYALKTLREDFEPRDIPHSELLALRRFLESHLPEET